MTVAVRYKTERGSVLPYFRNPIFDVQDVARMKIAAREVGRAVDVFEHRFNRMIENIIISDLESMTKEVSYL